MASPFTNQSNVIECRLMEAKQTLFSEQAIGPSNWNYCYYSTGPLKSMMSQGMDYASAAVTEESLPALYWVTVLRDETREIFQAEFSQLADAIKFINEKYGHWDFTDTTEDKGGCGSCANS